MQYTQDALRRKFVVKAVKEMERKGDRDRERDQSGFLQSGMFGSELLHTVPKLQDGDQGLSSSRSNRANG